MRKVRTLITIIVSILYLSVIAFFVRSLGPNYITPNQTSYEIQGMTGGINANKFNGAIRNYANKHKISVIKVFNVPAVNKNDEVTVKSYVYGKKTNLAKGFAATKDELLTSDVRYPLYFVGHTDKRSIEKMFKQNGIEFQHMKESWNWNIWKFVQDANVFGPLVLLLMMLGIVCILGNLQALKKINIRSLLGMSNFKDALDSFLEDLKWFSLTYIAGLIIIVLGMQFLGYINSLKITLYFALILYSAVLIVLLLSAFLRGRMHSVSTIVGAIKGNARSKLSFYINMVIKVIVEIFICVSFASLLGTLNHEQKLNSQLSVWDHKKTYYTVNLSSIKTTSQEEQALNHRSAVFFNYLAKHNGVLASYQGWDSSQEDFHDFYYGNVLNVNANYLKDNKVVDVTGKRLLLPANSATTYVLLPAAQYSQRQEIVQAYRRDLYLKQAERRTGKTLKIKVIKIKDGQRLFTYDIGALELGHYNGYVNSPALLVLSNQSLGGTAKNNQDANSIWITYLSNEALLSPDVGTVKKGLKKAKLTNYIGGIVNTKSYFLKQLTTVQRNLQLAFAVVTIAVIIMLLENFAFNSVYFNNNKKKIAIQRTLGLSFGRTFGKFMFLNLGLSIFEAAVVWMLTGNLTIMIALLVFSNLIELILLEMQARKLNRTIAESIKGE